MPATNQLAILCISAIFLLSAFDGNTSEQHQTHVVEIKQMSFVPKKLTVSAGDTVKWINRDLVAHNVSSEHWESPDLEQGEHFAVEVSGNASYKCSLHPVMKGVVSVKK
ncbi:MAG: plastocyanin/azurin family copper-binding protein [Balneolaceae bacterium]|nr:plastocyanin/azurin family copper-binding protein [Balneolaceae bacterium]